MAQVNKEERADQTAVLTITVQKTDYESQYNDQLKQYRRDGNFKGFRKGKAPMGFIKKLYGKSLLVNVVHHNLQNSLMDFLREEEMDFLGQPIPLEDNEEMDLDPNQLEDYSFKFEVGLAPSFELAGLEESKSFEVFKVKVPEERIDEELNQARERLGELKEVDGPIEKSDVVQIEAKELNEDGEIRENGWETMFPISPDLIVEDALDEPLIGKEVGYSFSFDVYNFEKGMSEESVVKYILKAYDPEDLEGVGRMFQGTVVSIRRNQPAELDSGFFEQAFQDKDVTSEEEARKALEENIKQYYNNQGGTFLWKAFKDYLMEQNPIELPIEFLKRWLKYSNENVTDENIAKEFDQFAENLKWSIVRRKLVERFEISVSDEDVDNLIIDNFMSRMGGRDVPRETVQMILDRYKEDENRVEDIRQDLISDRLFDALKGFFQMEDTEIELEAFDERIQEFREAILKENEPPVSDTVETTEATETEDNDKDEPQEETSTEAESPEEKEME